MRSIIPSWRGGARRLFIHTALCLAVATTGCRDQGGEEEAVDASGGSGGSVGGSGGTSGGGRGGGGQGGQGPLPNGGQDAALPGPDGAAPADMAAADTRAAEAGAADVMPSVSSEGDGKVTIKGPFKADPAQTVKAGVPRGARVDFTLSSKDSKVFPTVTGSTTTFDRPAAVYLPAGYVSGKRLPFMVVQDGVHGIAYINTMPAALDNLIQDKRIPAMAVVFVDPGPNGQRSVEYDTVSDKYTTFVETELLPAAKAAVKSKTGLELVLTTDPEGRGAMGGSSGGACAFTMGWFHPELYRRILTYSGSFVKLKTDATYPAGAGDYPRLIGAAPRKPLRVFLEVGTNDLDNQFGNWATANDAMAKALTDKGYHQRYVYAEGAGHVDGGVLTQTLAETLVWLWRGHPVE